MSEADSARVPEKLDEEPSVLVIGRRCAKRTARLHAGGKRPVARRTVAKAPVPDAGRSTWVTMYLVFRESDPPAVDRRCEPCGGRIGHRPRAVNVGLSPLVDFSAERSPRGLRRRPGGGIWLRGLPQSTGYPRFRAEV